MCAVSMIGDHFSDKWKDRTWRLEPATSFNPFLEKQTFFVPPISRQEFEDLKKEVLEMKALLTRALEYDRKTNQPNCHIENKVAILRKVADLVGVSLEDIFPVNKE